MELTCRVPTIRFPRKMTNFVKIVGKRLRNYFYLSKELVGL